MAIGRPKMRDFAEHIILSRFSMRFSPPYVIPALYDGKTYDYTNKPGVLRSDTGRAEHG